MGNEFENREQRRKMKKSRAKSGKAKATRATAVMMAALMATYGMSLPTGIFAYGAENNKLLAFAGAEGGGRYATGGRGYDVYVVTNLEDYGRNDKPVEGSLRYGIEEAAKNNGGTMIVFNVGGTIALKQRLTFAGRKNITLAGQTAPGDGITLSGYDTDISKYPIIEFYSGQDVDYEYTRGRITGINFKNKYPKKDVCYTLFEKYSKDGIKYELYKNDQLMKDYNSIPETADLKEPTDTKFMMAVPMMFNKSKKYKGRGQSIIEKKLDAFDSFDEVWSKWIDALRDNRTITYIPEDLIPTNENGDLLKPNTFDNRYAKVGSTTSETESSKITRKKGDFECYSHI